MQKTPMAFGGKYKNILCTPKQNAMSLITHRRMAHQKTTTSQPIESTELHTVNVDGMWGGQAQRAENAANAGSTTLEDSSPQLDWGTTVHANKMESTLRQIVRDGGCGKAWVNFRREVQAAYLQLLHSRHTLGAPMWRVPGPIPTPNANNWPLGAT